MPAEILSQKEASDLFDGVQQTAAVARCFRRRGALRRAFRRADAFRQQYHSSERGRAGSLAFGSRGDRPDERRAPPPIASMPLLFATPSQQALALARSAAPNSDLLPLNEPSVISETKRFDAATAAATPEHRGRAVAEAIRIVESLGQTAAGIYSTGQSVEAIFNSRGVAAWHAETMAQFSITAMAEDSSGWAKASAVSQ